MGLSRLKALNAVLPVVMRDYIFVDALMQMYEYQFLTEHPERSLNWCNVTGEDLVDNLVYLNPVAYDLGLGGSESRSFMMSYWL